MKRSEFEQAEHYSRQRAWSLPGLATLLVVQQGAFMAGGAGYGPAAVLSGVVWMLMTSLMIVIAATGGWIWVRSAVRKLMNDEVTVATRRKANNLGFLNAMMTCVLLYALTFVKEFTVREAVVVIAAVGLSSALLSFGVWERQALQSD